MPRGCCLALLLTLIGAHLDAADPASFPEYAVVHSATATTGTISYTYWQTKDLTSALGLWEAMRSPGDKSCDAAPFCSVSKNHGVKTLVFDGNYVLSFPGEPNAAQVAQVLAVLPDKKETSLPALLTFLPRTGLVSGSARYILGQASLDAYAPELSESKPGFDEGAEAQVAEYEGGAKLALFYYATPEMARLHIIGFKALGNVFAKRSGVLVAIVYGNVSQAQADTLLGRVEYVANVSFNETTVPPPIKAMYSLLLNIIYLSGIIVLICLVAGLMYGGMRVYRRKFGQLESQEAMTTLGLGGQ